MIVPSGSRLLLPILRGLHTGARRLSVPRTTTKLVRMRATRIPRFAFVSDFVFWWCFFSFKGFSFFSSFFMLIDSRSRSKWVHADWKSPRIWICLQCVFCRCVTQVSGLVEETYLLYSGFGTSMCTKHFENFKNASLWFAFLFFFKQLLNYDCGATLKAYQPQEEDKWLQRKGQHDSLAYLCGCKLFFIMLVLTVLD